MNLCDARTEFQGARKLAGQIARQQSGGLGEDHGSIRRQIAVGGIARRLDRDAGQIEPLRQHARPRQRLELLENDVLIVLEKIDHVLAAGSNSLRCSSSA